MSDYGTRGGRTRGGKIVRARHGKSKKLVIAPLISLAFPTSRAAYEQFCRLACGRIPFRNQTS